MSYLGIEQEMQFKNSAGYIQGWASNLKDDKNAILYATPKAIEAANIILNIQ
jgi:antirestriction protein ArdC